FALKVSALRNLRYQYVHRDHGADRDKKKIRNSKRRVIHIELGARAKIVREKPITQKREERREDREYGKYVHRRVQSAHGRRQKTHALPQGLRHTRYFFF